MMSDKLGEAYVSPCQLLFVVVVEARESHVVALVLDDRVAAKAPLRPGTIITVERDCPFWDESVPFASLPEGGTLSP